MIYYKFEYFNIPPPSKVQFPTLLVKFDEGPGFTWVLGSRVLVLHIALQQVIIFRRVKKCFCNNNDLTV